MCCEGGKEVRLQVQVGRWGCYSNLCCWPAQWLCGCSDAPLQTSSSSPLRERLSASSWLEHVVKSLLGGGRSKSHCSSLQKIHAPVLATQQGAALPLKASPWKYPTKLMQKWRETLSKKGLYQFCFAIACSSQPHPPAGAQPGCLLVTSWCPFLGSLPLVPCQSTPGELQANS